MFKNEDNGWVDNSGDNFFNFSRYSADDVEYLPTTKAKSKRIKRILMVDDELDITFSVKTALEDSGLFQVDMFNDQSNYVCSILMYTIWHFWILECRIWMDSSYAEN